MLTSPASCVNKTLKFVSLVFTAWLLGTGACTAQSKENVTVRHIGHIHSVIALRILNEVRMAPFSLTHDSPILLHAKTMSRLHHRQRQELKATYDAGYSIVLLDATMQDIKALHGVIGVGVSYRSKDTGVLLAYGLHREHHTPTATLVTRVDHSPLQTPSGDPDPTGLADEELALSRAAERTLDELRHIPQVSVPERPHDPNQDVAWQDNPLQTATFAISSPQGVYNTPINVYALHRCLDGTDHYVVTAGADWTATNAKWQGATSDSPDPSMYLDNNNQLVINWQDTRTYCSSPGYLRAFADVCRYINYPLSYELTMVPRTEGVVTQINTAPGGTQGQSASYTSGFTFSVGGTVNVSANGPGGGISVGASWNNTTQTTVPFLIVDVSNTGNEGARWNFKYCTTGLEPDPGTNCTSHVQMVKDVCQAQLGDDSGTNPQQGQTPVGKFSNASESAYWQTKERVGTTFDIEVAFQAHTANTIAHLGEGGPNDPDPIVGCNYFGCACVSVTTPNPVSKSITFEIPFPSTQCK
jgi:hypothetical protein